MREHKIIGDLLGKAVRSDEILNSFALREIAHLLYATVAINQFELHKNIVSKLLSAANSKLESFLNSKNLQDDNSEMVISQLTIVASAVESGAYENSMSNIESPQTDPVFDTFMQKLTHIRKNLLVTKSKAGGTNHKSNLKTTKFQTSARKILDLLNFPYTEETQIGPYVVDYLLKNRTALEFDGYKHFYFNSADLIVKSELKYRILRKLGVNVVSINYDEWRGKQFSEKSVPFLQNSGNFSTLPSLERKVAILKSKLEQETGLSLAEFQSNQKKSTSRNGRGKHDQKKKL